DELVRRIRQTWIGLNGLWIARPSWAKDADVGFTVAIPVADDRFVVARAKLGPQVTGVPAAIAVEVDEPLPIDIQAELIDAIAVEVTGDGDGVFESDHVAMDFVAVGVEEDPFGVGHWQIGPVELCE